MENRSVPELLKSHPSSFSKSDWELLRMNGITNGYGAKNQWFLKWIIARLAPSFREANSDLYDFSFKKGGSIEDFHKANRGFFIALVRDSIRVKKHSFFLFLYYISLSLVFYESVELFGKRYFNFS